MNSLYEFKKWFTHPSINHVDSFLDIFYPSPFHVHIFVPLFPEQSLFYPIEPSLVYYYKVREVYESFFYTWWVILNSWIFPRNFFISTHHRHLLMIFDAIIAKSSSILLHPLSIGDCATQILEMTLQEKNWSHHHHQIYWHAFMQ